MVRVHSECFTGDVLGSQRCDCGEQLNLSLLKIAEKGRGLLIYVDGHEGTRIYLFGQLIIRNIKEEELDWKTN